MNFQNLAYFKAHEESDSRFLRGRIAKDFVANTGLSKPTFYKHQKEFEKNNGIFTEKLPVIRMDPARYNGIVDDVFLIAMLQEIYHGCSSSDAVSILSKDGKLKVLHELDRSSTDRYLKRFGISNRMRKKRKAAISWNTDFSNQVIMCDASPISTVYMDFSGKLIVDPSTPYKDTKTLQKVDERKWTPVWGFHFVDVYSKAYFIHYIVCKGESTATWIEAFSKFLLHKKTHPLGGTIDLLYTDMGSGLRSIEFNGFLQAASPGTVLKTHPKGKPYSKGPVESRIGGHQKRYERFLKPTDFSNIDELNQDVLEFMIHDQVKNGKFKKYLEGLQLRPTPRKDVSQKNIDDARVGRIKRKVDAYRCLSLKRYKEERFYLIPVDIAQGEIVDVFFRGDDVFAQLPDSKIVQLSDQGPLKGDNPEAYEIPDRIKRVEAVQKNAKVFEKTINTKRSYIVPESDNIEAPQGQATITHSPVPPEHFMSVKEAVQYVVIETGYDEAEQVEGFIETITKMEAKFGQIEGKKIRDMVNYLIGIGRTG